MQFRDNQERFSDYYTFLGKLGKGAFGRVVHALDKQTGEELAVKIIRKRSMKKENIENIRQEAMILSSLSHPNIIQFKHIKETSNRLFIGMEIVFGGNLQELIKREEVSEEKAHSIMKQILSGVDYIHKQNVIHRDLKPSNILVTKDLTVKISDFGLSALCHPSIRHPSEKCGTLLFMAPEQAFSRYYSKAIDIWSCGIILYILLAKKHPIASDHDTTQVYLSKLENPKWKFPDGLNKLACELIENMLDSYPLTRYSASQALNHPWILKSCRKTPISAFEEFKTYSDQLKLKIIAFTALFGSFFYKKNEKPAAVKKVNDRRRATYMNFTKSYELKKAGSITKKRFVSPGVQLRQLCQKNSSFAFRKLSFACLPKN